MPDNTVQAQEYVSMGIELMRREKYTDAIDLFSKACSLDPMNYESFMHLGNAYVNVQEYDKAISAFSNALAIRPDSGEMLFSIGSVYYLQDDYVHAVKYYNKAEKAGYKNPEMYLIMADIFDRTEDPEQCLRCINRALEIAPLQGQIWRKKVTYLLNLQQFVEAQEALDEYLELLPDALDAYELQAQLLCSQEKYTEALEKIQIGLDRFPNDVRMKLIELRIYSEANNYDQVKALIREIYQSGASDGYRKVLGLEAAQVFIAEGKSEESINALEWALEETPGDEQLLYLLMNIYVGILDYQQILKAANRLLEKTPTDLSIASTARFYRALSLGELGKTEQSEVEFRQLAKDLRKMTIDKPEMTDIYLLRLLCHCNLKEYEKAFQLADYLQSISPDSAYGHGYRYLIYKQMGDEQKAEEELKEARKIYPDIAG